MANGEPYPRQGPLAEQKVGTCTWRHDCDNWGDYWETSCGNAYCFEYDLTEQPETNGYTFCPNCGQRIHLEPEKEEEEDADFTAEES